MNTPLPSGILTGPNLLSCIDELSLQDHDDLAHCSQIATRSADQGKSGRFVNSTMWMDEFMTTLDFLGWSLFQDAIFTRRRFVVPSSVADFLVLRAQAMPDKRQGNAMIDTLDALKSDNSAIASMDSESLLGKSFQVIPARYDSKGFLEIAVFNLELVAHTKRSNFLFLNWKGHAIEIIQQGAYLKLDKNVLKSKRALIDAKRREINSTRFDLWKNQ